ncbi:hypothetical protein Tco_0525029 [Tanacetum coccineum]
MRKQSLERTSVKPLLDELRMMILNSERAIELGISATVVSGRLFISDMVRLPNFKEHEEIYTTDNEVIQLRGKVDGDYVKPLYILANVGSKVTEEVGSIGTNDIRVFFYELGRVKRKHETIIINRGLVKVCRKAVLRIVRKSNLLILLQMVEGSVGGCSYRSI